MTTAEKIRVLREKKGYTQEALGKLCGTTKQTIQKYENGIVTNIPLDRVEQLARFLDTTPAYLAGWKEEPATSPIVEEITGIIGDMTDEQKEKVMSYIRFIKSGG